MFFIRKVGFDLAVVQVEDRGRAGLRDNGLAAAPAEAGEADAHAVLRDALAIPIREVRLGFGKEAVEGAGEAHVQRAERIPESGHDVPRERLSRRSGAFCEDEELCAVVGRSFAVKNPGIRAPVDRHAINYRELANLEWFGQSRPSFCSQDRQGSAASR